LLIAKFAKARKKIDLTTFFSNWKTKGLLLLCAILIGIGTLIYTNTLIRELKNEERVKIELWAKATKMLNKVEPASGSDVRFIFDVIEHNSTIPIILTNENDSVLYVRNINISEHADSSSVIAKQLAIMKKRYEPIEVYIAEDTLNYIYYNDSDILRRLHYYPWIQMLIISLFVIVAYLAFSASKVLEQNRVWVGMAKETAHQLGTPISSLMAWIELLKMQNVDESVIKEISKDTERLTKITDRFSKVGSAPELTTSNVVKVVSSTVEYLEARSPKRVHYTCNFNPFQEIEVPLNTVLFSWVIENLCKNAIDSIDGAGEINVSLYRTAEELFVDITDSGKGIPKSNHRSIFKPGFTTKKRGWGLGLSLAKRIVENYHSGKIFIRNSEPGIGSTFRIILQLNDDVGKQV
jgi:signal transduction histidine kinase